MQHADLNIVSITGANVFTILSQEIYEQGIYFCTKSIY